MQPNLEALHELKRVVRAVPPEHFNLGVWQCGSMLCALGAACIDSWFVERGLKFDGGNPYFAVDEQVGDKLYPFPFVSYDAGAAFFRFSPEESYFIFDPSSYGIKMSPCFAEQDAMERAAPVSREMVIERINQVIDSYTVQKDAHVRAWRAHRESERAASRDFTELLQPELEPA